MNSGTNMNVSIVRKAEKGRATQLNVCGLGMQSILFCSSLYNSMMVLGQDSAVTKFNFIHTNDPYNIAEPLEKKSVWQFGEALKTVSSSQLSKTLFKVSVNYQ